MKPIRIIALIAILLGTVTALQPWRFEREQLHAIAQENLHLRGQEQIDGIIHSLQQKYPGKIIQKPTWFWCNAGGAMWYVGILSISMWEYLIITGNSVGTAGHSGRNLVTYTDYVMDGKIHYSREALPFVTEVYTKGDIATAHLFEALSICIPETALLLEYARGPIITLLPFGIWSAFFSTLDFVSAAKALYCFAAAFIQTI